MSAWQDFLKIFKDNKRPFTKDEPGPVMISFVNRYLEPLDSIRYRVVVNGKQITGTTTNANHTVTVQPDSLKSIPIYAWSRVQKGFKQIDEITPRIGQRILVTERMKTFKHVSKTDLHPVKNPTPAPKATQQKTTVNKPVIAAPPGNQGVNPVITRNASEEPEHQTERSLPNLITVPQLKKIFPAALDEFLKNIADDLNVDLVKYKLDTPQRRAHFFAQVRQEAGAALSPKQENLNYRPPVLINKFRYFRNHPLEADEDGRLEEIKMVEKTVRNQRKMVGVKTLVHAANQPAIANKAYGNRDGNGNTASGDGWRFRGRGIFQLTSRNNYTAFNNQYRNYWNDKQVDFLADPDKVVEFPYFIRSAVWFWISQSAYRKADGGTSGSDIDAVTRVINGRAMDAAAERRHNFDELTYPAFK